MVARDGRGRSRARRSARERDEPLPLEAVNLLAGIAPGVVLEADAVPRGVAGVEDETAATASVDEVGRMLRSGDSTVRGLVRGRTVAPSIDGKGRDRATQRAGVPPRSPERPGE